MPTTDARIPTNAASRFDAQLARPRDCGEGAPWTFVVLPGWVSETLPRRGRTTVDGTLNGLAFRATLEPDGQLSHWLRVGDALRDAAGVQAGEVVSLTIAPVDEEPEPDVPSDFAAALAAHPDALAAWRDTTPVARLDWIHWIESAKKAATRQKRIASGCDMLSSGKRRVCCFDPSGFYSKSLSAPEALA